MEIQWLLPGKFGTCATFSYMSLQDMGAWSYVVQAGGALIWCSTIHQNWRILCGLANCC